ncbi:MAG: GNAT family N-acetyltransferase [Bacteroidetes bacterium]|nr:GNAT family N-acetyltransferase [Bacteroidota bacterium]
MVKYIIHNKINFKKWDECIEQSMNGVIYAKSLYLDNMSPGWDALILGDYEAVMPVTWRKKWRLKYLAQPAFSQQLGIFYRKKLPLTSVHLFLEELKRKFLLIDINLNHGNSILKQLPQKCNLIIDLKNPFDETKKGFRKDLITRAIKHKLDYNNSDDYRLAIRFFREIYAEINGVRRQDYLQLSKLCKQLLLQELLLVPCVKGTDGQLLSIALLIKDKKRIYYILGASSAKGRREDANAYLIYETIKQFSETKLLFDFEGSDHPQIKSFFKKFGAMEELYPFYQYNNLPAPYKLIKNFKERFSR